MDDNDNINFESELYNMVRMYHTIVSVVTGFLYLRHDLTRYLIPAFVAYRFNLCIRACICSVTSRAVPLHQLTSPLNGPTSTAVVGTRTRMLTNSTVTLSYSTW